MGDLRSHACGINSREATRLLLYRPRYSDHTLFTGITRLTERATAYFGGHLFVRYPAPALHTSPRELTTDADVLGAFVRALDDALDARPLEPDRTLFHLTGGFDSGTVATRAAERYPQRLSTSALLIGGPGRKQQIRRRREMRGALPFGPVDELVDAMAYLPLHPGCLRVQGATISPYEDPLHYPFARMTERIAATGAHTVVTGIGGDEMVALSQTEHPHRAAGSMKDAESLPWIGQRIAQVAEFGDDGIAPAAAVNSMTLLSLESAAPVLLRAGLWPVHPFETGLVDPDGLRKGVETLTHASYDEQRHSQLIEVIHLHLAAVAYL